MTLASAILIFGFVVVFVAFCFNLYNMVTETFDANKYEKRVEININALEIANRYEEKKASLKDLEEFYKKNEKMLNFPIKKYLQNLIVKGVKNV